MLFSLFLLANCSFFSDGDLIEEELVEEVEQEPEIQITGLKFNKNTMKMKVGEIEYLTLTITPKDVHVEPVLEYDSTKLKVELKNNGLVIEALAEGQVALTASFGTYSATCIFTIEGFEEGFEVVSPYIYSNASILQLNPGHSEKIFVSLYGGSASDINEYSWTTDASSICNIQPTGQYCVITAKEDGYSRIKVTHPKATYPYYVGVYVFSDATKNPYITTSDNIITLNQEDGEMNISCSLVNALESSMDSAFKWEILESDSEQIPVRLNYNGMNAIVSPITGGSCTIRITHPDAQYPLDILCRVITIVKNVYIEPSQSIIVLDGDKEVSVSNQLKNIKEGEYSVDEFNYSLINNDIADITASIGNTVYLRGTANGSTKLLVSHPKSEYTREVLLISQNQIKDAVDASCYITTTQNYIRTKVGATQTKLNISLLGGDVGDEKDFSWAIKHYPNDESNDDVIKVETTHGKVFSRMANQSLTNGESYITPLKEGTATITVTHPKVLYPTEILIKVLDKDAILESPMYFIGDGILKIVNGNTKDYSLSLKGDNVQPSDKQNIKWETDDNRLIVNGNEETAQVTAPPVGTGQTISHLNASHPKVDVDKSILVLTADTKEELDNMKALYTNKNYFNFEVGTTVMAYVNSVGYEDGHDFSLLNWTVNDPSIATVQRTESPKSVEITGLKAGTTKLVARYDGLTCEYTITVYPTGAIHTEPEVYLTTGNNVVVINDVNTAKTVNITAINLPLSRLSEITWECEDSSICSVIANGDKATIKALKLGETKITIAHPDSQNSLVMYVRVGNEYVVQNGEPVVYISSQDVLTMLKDDAAQKLQAVLVNNKDNTPNVFSFTIDNPYIADIVAQSTEGIAYVKPKNAGQAEITIKNNLTEITKKVLVIVGNSLEELSGYVYMTTNSNVVSINEGNSKTVSVSIKNSPEVILDGYQWTSSDRSIVDVIGSGATVSFKANKVGTAIVTVSNRACKYSLEIIVQIIDPNAAIANPYIQLSSSVILLTVGNSYTDISADIIGGNQSDYSNFLWTANDGTIVSVYGQNEIGKIKALKTGQTYVTVSHPKAEFSAQLLVICEEKKQSECYISVPSSIMSIKPTDSAQTITATLINGDATDKYNFKWSLDVYDVVDFQYSANVCTIKPKQTGAVTITISHPKASYDQQIIVNVQEYTEFAFPKDNFTMYQGDVNFISMQVPNTSVKTHIEYTSSNQNIVSVQGTKAVAQVTGINSGTCTVTARLIASATGVEQAKSEMMVYVKEKPTISAYITAANTIFTLNRGKSTTISASLSGSNVDVTDQPKLRWTTSDSDVIQLTGLQNNGYVEGSTIYVTALKGGEAVITCSHEKANSDLQFYVVVPGTGKKAITLDKTYLTIQKGSSGSAITATIENAESNDDYNKIEWSIMAPNGADGNQYARLMGNGKKVQVYPVSAGRVTVYAQLPDVQSVAQCDVEIIAGKSLTFENTQTRVAPLEEKYINYTVSPTNARITWTVNSTDDYFSYKDSGYDTNGNGRVLITGLHDGDGMLMGTTDGGAVARLSVRCGWNYQFSLNGAKSFDITPDETLDITYSVTPGDCDIYASAGIHNEYVSVTVDPQNTTKDNGTGVIHIRPIKECRDKITIQVTATNPNDNGTMAGGGRVEGYIRYKQVTPYLSYGGSSGKYSYYGGSGGTWIGDGETQSFTFGFYEGNKTDAYVSNVQFVNKKGEYGISTSFSPGQDGKSGSFTISGGADYIEYTPMYYIKWLKMSNTYRDWKNFGWYLVTEKDRNRRIPEQKGFPINQYNYYTYENGWRDAMQLRYKNIGSGTTYGEFCDAADESWGKDDEDDGTGTGKVFGKGYWQQKGTITYPSASSSGTFNGTVYFQWMCNTDTSDLIEDSSMSGKYMSVDEFRNCAWLYCPGTPTWDDTPATSGTPITNSDFEGNNKFSGMARGPYGTNAKINIPEHIMSGHVDATLTDVASSDTSNRVAAQAGELWVYVSHLGRDDAASRIVIPVNYIKKACPCN